MSTMLKIHDREYDLEDATSNAGLNILIYMKKRLGISMKTIVTVLEGLDLNRPLDLFDDENALEALQGLLWLVKTQAGERAPDGSFLTLEGAAEGVGFTDFQFSNPDADTESDAAPKELEAALSSPS